MADNDSGVKPTGSMFSSFTGFSKDSSKPGANAFSFLSSATNGDTSKKDEKDNSTGKLSSATAEPAVGIIDKNQLDYYGSLKGLNQSIAKWIKEKVEQNPYCILTPIFDDYAKHLRTIQDKHKEDKKKSIDAAKTSATTIEPAKASFTFGSLAPSTTTAFSNNSTPYKPLFGLNSDSSADAKKAETTAPATSAAKQPTFSFGGLTSTAPTSSTFSFGGPGVKPFTFSNVAKPVDSSKPSDSNDNDGGNGGGAEADEDQPPKYEFVPVVEKDNFYSKRCKVFVKNDKSYADRGVGMLYLKKVESSGKTQLLVRADTSLGNILLNVLLSEGLPTQRMGKKDVMLICLPLPDAQGPTSVLIRVKNEEEADDLLEEINKNKK